MVVLGDVSGSMERYSRMLMHFVYGVSRSTAPLGTGPSVFFTKPAGAPRRATTEPGLMPSFFGSGVPE